MEYYSAIKRTKAFMLAITWMHLEHTTLSERRQTRKATRCAIPFM